MCELIGQLFQASQVEEELFEACSATPSALGGVLYECDIHKCERAPLKRDLTRLDTRPLGVTKLLEA